MSDIRHRIPSSRRKPDWAITGCPKKAGGRIAIGSATAAAERRRGSLSRRTSPRSPACLPGLRRRQASRRSGRNRARRQTPAASAKTPRRSPRPSATAWPAPETGPAAQNRMDGMGRQLAQHHIVSLEIGEEQQPQGAFALFHGEAVGGDENSSQQAEAQRRNTQRHEKILAQLARQARCAARTNRKSPARPPRRRSASSRWRRAGRPPPIRVPQWAIRVMTTKGFRSTLTFNRPISNSKLPAWEIHSDSFFASPPGANPTAAAWAW